MGVGVWVLGFGVLGFAFVGLSLCFGLRVPCFLFSFVLLLLFVSVLWLFFLLFVIIHIIVINILSERYDSYLKISNKNLHGQKMNTVELIRKKRDGSPLAKEEIDSLISGYAKGKIPDYQVSALLMAAYLKGLDKNETFALTNAMLNSGKLVDLSHIKGKKIDKHSTGGVGDKTSLIIAPIVAATGIYVPMISGRGLGHTGGTLDKLESISGFKTDLNLNRFRQVLEKCGFVMSGQTKDIVPADKLLYALRDVTGTIESIPLITTSQAVFQ